MNTMKHTPKPWYVHLGNKTLQITDHAPGKTSCGRVGIAQVEWLGEGGRHVQAANARLIVAAPEMLEALEGILEHCSLTHNRWGEDCNRDEANAAIAAARAAIDKATGQSEGGA